MESATKSILLTVKKMLGIAEEYHAFDLDITIDINSVFLTLNQLGVGPDIPYQITDENDTWANFLGEDLTKFAGIETYVYLKTRLLFDPPTNSFLVTAMQDQCAEFEWRFNMQAEGGKTSDDDDLGSDTETEDENPDIQPDEPGGEVSTFSFSRVQRRRRSEAELLRAAWHKGNEMGSTTDSGTIGT